MIDVHQNIILYENFYLLQSIGKFDSCEKLGKLSLGIY
jgi:hypothetical protein